MPLRRITAAAQTPLMTRNAILMRLQTAVLASAMAAHRQQIVDQIVLTLHQPSLRPPSERKVARADHFDEIHVVVGRIVRLLHRRV